MREVLAFDCGEAIVGILDVDRNEYTAYRSAEMINGARRLAFSQGTLVSFNGNAYDLPKLARILSPLTDQPFPFSGQHDDMATIISTIRWPPDPGTNPIRGQCLLDNYRHYCGAELPTPTAYLADEYEVDNWRDCYMSAELWKIWKQGHLVP